MSGESQGKRSAGRRGRWLAAIATVAAIAVLSWLAFILAARKPGPVQETISGSPLIPLKSPEEFEKDFLRPELRRALGMRKGVSPAERLDILRSLEGDLIEEECEAILAALLERRPPGMEPGWHSEYVHELCCLMQRGSSDHERFARVLATLAGDARREEVIRDYAMQHLRRVWNAAANAEGLRPSIEATFRNLAERDPVLSASALLSLHLLGTGFAPEDHPSGAAKPLEGFALPDSEIAPVVASILAEAPVADGVKTRLTALRIVGDRRMNDRREDVRRMIEDDSEHTLVRMAAIAALARIGDAADRSLIESLDQTDPRIATAVRHALARLR